MKIKVTDIINPIHPNRSTALFGGVSSGILNWNDLRYPELYKKRERLRATFWSMSDVDWETIDSYDVDVDKERYGKLLHSNFVRIESIQRIADVSSDAAVMSVLSTMIDQLNEHNLVLRKLSEVDTIRHVHSESPGTLEELFDMINTLIIEYEEHTVPRSVTSEHDKIHNFLTTDYDLHIDFFKTIYNLSVKEHRIKRELYRVGEIVTTETAPSLDNFDDL